LKQKLTNMAFLAAAFLLCSCIPARATQMQVYGAWHHGKTYHKSSLKNRDCRLLTDKSW